MTHSRTVPTALLTVALSLGMALGTMAPAAGESRMKPDRRGDAPASIDVGRTTYTHDRDRVRVRARIPGLGDRGTAVLRVSRYTIFEAGYVVKIRQRADRPARVSLHYFDHFDLEKRRCPGVGGTWGPGKVILSVPRSCLGEHRRPRLFTQFAIQQGTQVDTAPAIRRLRREGS